MRLIDAMAKRIETMEVVTAAGDLCPDCDGFGNIITANGAKPCHCKLERQRKANIQNANLPRQAARMTLESYSPENASQKRLLAICRSYLECFYDKRRPGLLLWGAPGNGKTHLATAILHDLLERGLKCKFWNYSDLFDRLVRSYNTETEFDVMLKTRSHVLLIDDLGFGRVTEHRADVVGMLINHRYVHRQPMIFTTNMNWEDGEVEEAFGLAMMSRIKEHCTVVQVTGEDYREKHLVELKA